jgi:uncharacterized protein YeaO (DUF488 family)
MAPTEEVCKNENSLDLIIYVRFIKKMPILTKSIKKTYESPFDGLRVCITNRLTRSDGQTPVERWYKGYAFDYWAKILSPPKELVGAYYRGEMDWQDFSKEYRTYLRKNKGVQKEMMWIGERALEEVVTLLCVEDFHHQCHRSILAEEMQRLVPKLKVFHVNDNGVQFTIKL